jgi:hypothetical protein
MYIFDPRILHLCFYCNIISVLIFFPFKAISILVANVQVVEVV